MLALVTWSFLIRSWWDLKGRSCNDRDEPQTSWLRHYNLSGPLILDENSMFTLLYNSIIPHPILMRIDWIDVTLIEMNPIHYDDIIITDFGQKYHVYTYTLIISQPILMRFYKIDHTLIELNSRRLDDIITIFPVHWFRAETACLHLSLDHFANDFDET